MSEVKLFEGYTSEGKKLRSPCFRQRGTCAKGADAEKGDGCKGTGGAYNGYGAG